MTCGNCMGHGQVEQHRGGGTCPVCNGSGRDDFEPVKVGDAAAQVADVVRRSGDDIDHWRQEAKRFEAQRDTLHKGYIEVVMQRDELLAMLRDVEWSAGATGGACPVCPGNSNRGHEVACRLGMLTGTLVKSTIWANKP